MFLKFSDGRYINSKYIEAFGIQEEEILGKIQKKSIWVRLLSGTLYTFNYGHDHALNMIDYKLDKETLKDLAEMRGGLI